MVDEVLKNLDKIENEEIKVYSYPFFILLRFVKCLCNLRLREIRKRREEYKIFCKIRENKLEEKIKREQLLKTELDLAKQEFYSNLD